MSAWWLHEPAGLTNAVLSGGDGVGVGGGWNHFYIGGGWIVCVPYTFKWQLGVSASVSIPTLFTGFYRWSIRSRIAVFALAFTMTLVPQLDSSG